MNTYASAILAATITAPLTGANPWNMATRALRRRTARRTLAAALAINIAGCALAALTPACVAENPESIPCEAGVAPPANCIAPPHGTVHYIDEPGGVVSCIVGLCEPGWSDCDGNPENGCETSLLSVTSCGVCGRKCPAEMICGGNPGISIACAPSPPPDGGD